MESVECAPFEYLRLTAEAAERMQMPLKDVLGLQTWKSQVKVTKKARKVINSEPREED